MSERRVDLPGGRRVDDQPPVEDVRNAMTILQTAAVRAAGSYIFEEVDVTTALRLLRAAVTKLEGKRW